MSVHVQPVNLFLKSSFGVDSDREAVKKNLLLLFVRSTWPCSFTLLMLTFLLLYVIADNRRKTGKLSTLFVLCVNT